MKKSNAEMFENSNVCKARQGRRGFIKSALAFSAMPYLRTFAEQGKPLLRMGVLSDIHVRAPGWSQKPFEAALRWFDAQKVDGVIVAGDMADFGLVEQLRLVGAAWDAVFPNNRAADGRKVEKVFVTGNHDHHFHNHRGAKKMIPDDAKRFAHSLAHDFNAAWTGCFHEEYRPFYRKEIKGFAFLARQYGEKGLSKFVAAQKATLDPAKPFFYVQHQHLKDTCYGAWAWGRDNGESTRVFSAFPNAVAFSGHSHYTLTDERSVWQGAFTSVGTASLSYISPPDGYENGHGNKPRVEEMPPLGMHQAKQGMLMDVFADRIVLARKLLTPERVDSLGPDWTIRAPAANPPQFAFGARAAKDVPPEFPAGAKVDVEIHDGANRNGDKHRQVRVTFPAAVAGGRAFDYEVRAEADGCESVVRRVLSKSFHMPKSDDGGKDFCEFAAADLPAKCRFNVSARTSFGTAGKTLVSPAVAVHA